MYEKFERLCEERGVTAYRVAKETGITTAAISNWKNGKYNFKADKLKKIADYFGVELDYFYSDDQVQKMGQDEGYYVYGESARLAQELFENKDMRALLDAARDVKPEDIRAFTDLLKRLKQTNPDG